VLPHERASLLDILGRDGRKNGAMLVDRTRFAVREHQLHT
jgi:hypothetical protein